MKKITIMLNIIAITMASIGFGVAILNHQALFIFIYGGLIAFNAFLLQKNIETN